MYIYLRAPGADDALRHHGPRRGRRQSHRTFSGGSYLGAPI